MINILIDGNYIFHKTFGMFAGYSKDVDPSKILGTKESQTKFMQKVAIDLYSLLSDLPKGDRLMFTIDSKSWRKEYYEGYKSKREDKRGESGADKAKWAIFFELLGSFAEYLETIGAVFSKVENAEGDDVIWLYSEHLNSLGENCIIISGDMDLTQLVSVNSNSSWTIVWNAKMKNNVLSIDKAWIEHYLGVQEEVSVFNMAPSLSADKRKLRDILNKAEVNIVDQRKFIFIKMFAGDTGDDVPSIWSHIPTGKIRLVRVTELKAEKIWNSFNETEWKDLEFSELVVNEDFLDWAAKYSIRLINGLDSTDNRTKAKENLLRNFDLMWLNEESLPSYVLESLKSELTRGLSLPRTNIILSDIKSLKNTEWTSNGNYTPEEHNPFQLF